MKRSVKILIITLAIALVLGIGAVSFAFWYSGDSESVPISGNAAVIETVGKVEVSADDTSKDGDNLKRLLPIDFLGTASDGVLYWGFDIVAEGGNTVKLEGSIAGGDSSVAELYYSTTAPSEANREELIPEDGATINLSGGKATVYVYMVAYSTKAMNSSIKLTFTAST
ncbi:MAG: hypothetical protein J1G04_05305 [Clostridiales bacterium]|nr:hypothetical protein [Clostridiales bacterium]